jgi:hypothetical protein
MQKPEEVSKIQHRECYPTSGQLSTNVFGKILDTRRLKLGVPYEVCELLLGNRSQDKRPMDETLG